MRTVAELLKAAESCEWTVTATLKRVLADTDVGKTSVIRELDQDLLPIWERVMSREGLKVTVFWTFIRGDALDTGKTVVIQTLRT